MFSILSKCSSISNFDAFDPPIIKLSASLGDSNIDVYECKRYNLFVDGYLLGIEIFILLLSPYKAFVLSSETLFYGALFAALIGDKIELLP